MECWNQLACHTALVARHQKWHQTSIETDGTPSHSIKENLKRGKRLKKKQIALGTKRNCTASKNLKSRIWRETLQSARGQNRQRRKLCWVKKDWVDITSYQFDWQKSDQLTHFFICGLFFLIMVIQLIANFDLIDLLMLFGFFVHGLNVDSLMADFRHIMFTSYPTRWNMWTAKNSWPRQTPPADLKSKQAPSDEFLQEFDFCKCPHRCRGSSQTEFHFVNWTSKKCKGIFIQGLL